MESATYMRIQEMKSGFLHLRKKVENERLEDFFETGNATIDPETESVSPVSLDCELDEPDWSVVSFDQLEAGGLTYKQAAELMKKLNSHGVSGLCIVTDGAASRIRG